MKEGREGGEGRKETFFSFVPYPLPALLVAPFFGQSLTLFGFENEVTHPCNGSEIC